MSWDDEDVWGWNFSYKYTSNQELPEEDGKRGKEKVCPACEGDHTLEFCPNFMGSPPREDKIQGVSTYIPPQWSKFQYASVRQSIDFWQHPLEKLMETLEENSIALEESINDMTMQRIYEEQELLASKLRAMSLGIQLWTQDSNPSPPETYTQRFGEEFKEEGQWNVAAPVESIQLLNHQEESSAEQCAPYIQESLFTEEETNFDRDVRAIRTILDALKLYDGNDTKEQEDYSWMNPQVTEHESNEVTKRKYIPDSFFDDQFFVDDVAESLGASESEDDQEEIIEAEKTPTNEEVLMDLHLDSLFGEEEEESIPSSSQQSVPSPEDGNIVQAFNINTFSEYQDPFLVWTVNPTHLLREALNLFHYTFWKSFIKRMVQLGYDEITARLCLLLVSYTWIKGKPLILKPP